MGKPKGVDETHLFGTDIEAKELSSRYRLSDRFRKAFLTRDHLDDASGLGFSGNVLAPTEIFGE